MSSSSCFPRGKTSGILHGENSKAKYTRAQRRLGVSVIEISQKESICNGVHAGLGTMKPVAANKLAWMLGGGEHVREADSGWNSRGDSDIKIRK